MLEVIWSGSLERAGLCAGLSGYAGNSWMADIGDEQQQRARKQANQIPALSGRTYTWRTSQRRLIMGYLDQGLTARQAAELSGATLKHAQRILRERRSEQLTMFEARA